VSSVSPAFRAEYLRNFDETFTAETPADSVRFVVLDSETTGLDPRKDRLITIGAVAVINGEILLDDVFDALLEVSYNSSAVTVHGVTRQESQSGVTEPEALERFLAYLQDGVIVGHHIGHDVATLNAGYERHWGFSLQNRSLDTMDLALNLERDGAFPGSNPGDKLIDLAYAVKSGYRANGTFVFNRATQAVIRKMKDGDGNYLWQPAAKAGDASTLMGFPVAESEDMPDMAADSYSVAFGDFRRGYLIVDRVGIRVLRDPYSSKPYVLFYTTKRVGGGVQDFDAIKLLKFAA